MMEGIDLTIDSLKEQLNDIKARISQCRKKGLSTRIPETRVMSVPAKIKMLEITKDFKDVQKINAILEMTRKDIEYIEKKEPEG